MAGPLNPRHPTGLLSIDDNAGSPVSMHTYAWNVLDLTELWSIFVAVRGDNVTIPHLEGTRPYPRRRDESRHSLEMALTGICDKDRTYYADYWIGYETNLGYLEANIVGDPPGSATRDASIVMPSGTTRTAAIQVLGIVPVHHGKGELAAATLEIVVPAGYFA